MKINVRYSKLEGKFIVHVMEANSSYNLYLSLEEAKHFDFELSTAIEDHLRSKDEE